MQKTILAIGDVHAPFTNTISLRRIEHLAKQLKPTVIIQIGDLLDLFSFSKYPRTHNLMTPKQELESGQKMAQQMWENLKKASPLSKCIQLIGNHDERPKKKLMQFVPEFESLFNLKPLFSFPKVETLDSEREHVIIDDIHFMHGFRPFGEHVRHNLRSTVCGHSHTGGVKFMRLGDKTLFELNCGFIAKENSPALGYTRTKISKWTQGVGYIDALGPRFIPFSNV